MDDLKVPIRCVDVEVTCADGTTARGSMYHAERIHQTGSAEDILEELNDERRFLPFDPVSASVGELLLNKGHIVRIHVPDLAPGDLRPDEVAEIEHAPRCTLWLRDGTRLAGRPVVETPEALSRVVDKLNRAQRFMPFVSEDGVDFIQVCHIVQVVRET